jgi:hypothetical protein
MKFYGCLGFALLFHGLAHAVQGVQGKSAIVNLRENKMFLFPLARKGMFYPCTPCQPNRHRGVGLHSGLHNGCTSLHSAS